MRHDDEALEALTRPRHAKFWTVDRLIKLLVFACFLVVAGFVFLLRQQGLMNGRISDQEVDTEMNRAVSCRVLVAVGHPLDLNGPCYAPEVLRHYDPDRTRSSVNENRRDQALTQRLLCEVLEAHGETAVEC